MSDVGLIPLVETPEIDLNFKRITDFIRSALVPVGGLIEYGGTTAPSGFLKTDGTGYSTATYSRLFAVIGYSFGGAGATFNVPNLVGAAGTVKIIKV